MDRFKPKPKLAEDILEAYCEGRKPTDAEKGVAAIAAAFPEQTLRHAAVMRAAYNRAKRGGTQPHSAH
jgi:hypothetical protein